MKYQELMNIPITILNIAEQESKKNDLLGEAYCQKFEVIEIKKELKLLMTRFLSERYLYSTALEDDININSNIEKQFSKMTFLKSSKTEITVEKYLDRQSLLIKLYNSLMTLSQKLTKEEAIYLINTFFYQKSEECIAEKLEMSKTYLQKIKKSCIIKMWMDLCMFCSQNQE